MGGKNYGTASVVNPHTANVPGRVAHLRHEGGCPILSAPGPPRTEPALSVAEGSSSVEWSSEGWEARTTERPALIVSLAA